MMGTITFILHLITLVSAGVDLNRINAKNVFFLPLNNEHISLDKKQSMKNVISIGMTNDR